MMRQPLVKRYISAAVMAEKSILLEKPIAIHLPNETTALQRRGGRVRDR